MGRARALLWILATACGGGHGAAPDAPGGPSDAPPDALPVLPSTISDCATAPGPCAAADLGAADHAISPMLFGDGIEWDGYGQDVLDPDPTGQTAGTLRPDVMAALGSVGFTLMRYPGGTLSDQFHWQQAVGPIASRTAQPTLATDTSGAVVTEVPRFGPDEFAGFAHQLGTDILVTVNVGTGTAQEAAAWVQYWEAEGVTIKYVEIGNEMYLDGPTFAKLDPVGYAHAFDAYATAIRAVDPALLLGAIGTLDTSSWCYPNCTAPAPWNQQVLTTMQQKADFFSVHDAYAPGTDQDGVAIYQAMLAYPDFTQLANSLVAGDIDLFGNAQTKGIPIAITEHAPFFLPTPGADAGTIFAQVTRNQTWAAALYSAVQLHGFARSSRVQIADHINPISPVWQAPINVALPPADRATYVPEPTQSAFGLVFAAYRELAGAMDVPVTVTGSPTIDSEAISIVPALTTAVIDALAARGTSASWLFLANRDLAADHATSFVLTDIPAGATTVRIEQLSADYLATNAPGATPEVAWTELAYGALPAGATTFGMTVALPKCSLVRIRVE